MKLFNFKFLVLLSVITFAFSACAKQEGKRVFDEIVILSPRGQVDMANPHAAIGLPSPSEMAKTPKMPMDMSQLPMGSAEKPDLKLSWKLPVDWVQRESSGMRLATFSTGSDQNYAECTIISLSGQAGGSESNIKRWMGQVAIEEPSQAEFKKFLAQQESFKTQDGSSATFVDLTQLQKDKADNEPSILATIIDFKGSAVFVKMMGTKAALSKNREKFRALCQSLKISE